MKTKRISFWRKSNTHVTNRFWRIYFLLPVRQITVPALVVQTLWEVQSHKSLCRFKQANCHKCGKKSHIVAPVYLSIIRQRNSTTYAHHKSQLEHFATSERTTKSHNPEENSDNKSPAPHQQSSEAVYSYPMLFL